MKDKDKKKLSDILNISSNLAETAYQYWRDFELNPKQIKHSRTKPALYAFSGAAYQGLNVSTCTKEEIGYLQSNLRIIDPLYGVLRPLDRMQPYRLEMATKQVFGEKKPLAEWWKDAVTSYLSNDLESRPEKILLNLASDEYSAAVDPKSLPEGTHYIKVIFRHQGRVIAVHAKRARGLMARYLAEEYIKDIDGIKRFDYEGYRFQAKDSDDTTLVFDLESTPPKAKRESTSSAKPNRKKTKM